MNVYNDSLQKALEATFPEMTFKGKTVAIILIPAFISLTFIVIFFLVFLKGNSLAKGEKWADVQHRRDFFCRLGEEMGFDPLRAENWKRVTKSQVLSRGVHIYLFPFYLFFMLTS